MTPHAQRAEAALSPADRIGQPLPAQSEDGEAFETLPWTSEPDQAPVQERGAGGRRVLGWSLTVLAVLWLGFSAWSAGQSLAILSAPAAAQWIAVTTGPLALLGLAWLVFGRTRRREAERFTQSVIAMRHEAHSLEALLGVLSQRLHDSESALSTMAERLMRLGDDTTSRFDGLAVEVERHAIRIERGGTLLDQAAEAARNDIGVLLADLPQAQESAESLSAALRASSADARDRAAELAAQTEALTERAREADEHIGGAAQRLVAHLTHLESAGAAATARVAEADGAFSATLDAMLEKTAAALEEIRAGVDAQSSAVTALVDQSAAAIGRAGRESAEALEGSLHRSNQSVGELSAKVAEQERASQRMFAEVERGLALIDERFTALAANGDQRANHFLGSLSRARAELDALLEQTTSEDTSLQSLCERTSDLQQMIGGLADSIRDELGGAIGSAREGTERLAAIAEGAKPEISWIRDAAVEASSRLEGSATQIGEQQDRLTALLAAIDDGVGGAEQRLADLTAAIAGARNETTQLASETGPALVAALVQVREAASHAAERAREAINSVIPQGAAQLGDEARRALETAIRESIEERLRAVEEVAAQAIDRARAASERLTEQTLALGRGAAALDAHFQEREDALRERDSEAFGRRVSLLIDSMHSAAIDVGKILSDEVDDKAWAAYLKGNRGVFTRRAVQLIGGSESRSILAHYEADAEFQASVNRYVHDFEAMLRRVMAERDGGMIAVTMMSSDTGKLYAALAQAIEKRR